jgi:signal transduction histidine kinase/DNA-binding NarL/FixJ family response regulator
MAVPPRRRTVWVVDDSPLDADRARRALEPHYVVVVLDDGAAALERLSHGAPPDVVVLDWVMPGMSGPEVCRFVRASPPPLGELALLLLTAHRDTQQIVEGLSAGANDFVAKPFEADELRARVGALVRARELRERAEVAEELSQRLLAAAPDPMFAVDHEGKVTFANEAGKRALGPSAGALVGQRISELIPDLPRRHIAVMPGQPLFPPQDIRLNGRVYSPAIGARQGDPEGTSMITLRDVTESRRADTLRLDFYSMITHDLRSPLAATLLRTDLILRGKHGPLTPTLTESIRKVDASLRGLVSIVGDFLDLAKLQGMGHDLERASIDVVQLVDSVMDELSPLVDLNRLTWRPVRPEGGACTMGDQRRLRQVLSNLAANAIKFTPPGGTVTTRVVVGEGFVEVAIEDTGRGISSEALPTIFDRYTREVDPLHEVAGTGLGLMIVRQIVEAHGGLVGAESSPGVGSRFWFRLTRVEA